MKLRVLAVPLQGSVRHMRRYSTGVTDFCVITEQEEANGKDRIDRNIR